MTLKKSLLTITIVLGFASCSKEEVVNVTSRESTQSEVQEFVQATVITEDLSVVLEKALKNTLVKQKGDIKRSSCISKRLTDIDENTRVLTLDFGSGCRDFITGRELSGKLLIKISVPDNGYKKQVDFVGFHINGIKIEGSISLEKNLDTTNGNNPSSKFDAILKITLPSGKFISPSGFWIKEQVKGANTPLNILDDEYEITGSWASLNSDFSDRRRITIIRPLVRKSFFKCKFISSGTILFSGSDKEKRFTLDFGNGTCDDKVTVEGLSEKPKVLSISEFLKDILK